MGRGLSNGVERGLIGRDGDRGTGIEFPEQGVLVERRRRRTVGHRRTLCSRRVMTRSEWGEWKTLRAVARG